MKKGITLIIISLFVSQLIVSEAFGLSVRQGQQPITPVDALARYDEIVKRDEALLAVDLVKEIHYEIDAKFSGYSEQQIKAALNEYVKFFFEHSVRGIIKSFVRNYLSFHNEGMEISVSENSRFEIVTLNGTGRAKLVLGRDIIKLRKNELEIDAMPLFDALAEYCVAMIVASEDFQGIRTAMNANENMYYWVESLKMVINLDFYPLWLTYKKEKETEWRRSKLPLFKEYPDTTHDYITQNFVVEGALPRETEVKQYMIWKGIVGAPEYIDDILYDYGYLLYNKRIEDRVRDKIFRRILLTYPEGRVSLAKLRDLIYCVFYAYEGFEVVPPRSFWNVSDMHSRLEKLLNAKNETDFYQKYYGILKDVLNMSDTIASEEIVRLIDDEGFFPKRPGGGTAINMIAEFKRNFFMESEPKSLEQIMNDYAATNRPITKEHATLIRDGFYKQNEYAKQAARRSALRSIVRELLKRRYGLKVIHILEAYFNGTLAIEGIDIMYSVEPFPKMLPFGYDADNPGNLVKDPGEYQEIFEDITLEYARKMVGEDWRQSFNDWYKKMFYLGALYKKGNRAKTYSFEEQRARIATFIKALEQIYKQQNSVIKREDLAACLKSA
jgi:hypothetical protein